MLAALINKLFGEKQFTCKVGNRCDFYVAACKIFCQHRYDARFADWVNSIADEHMRFHLLGWIEHGKKETIRGKDDKEQYARATGIARQFMPPFDDSNWS